MMSMQSLALLPELQSLPAAEDAVDLGFADTVTRLRGMDKDHFAIEIAEGVDESVDGLFNAVPNVPDELSEAHELLYPDSTLPLHEHYQEMVERGGQVSNRLRIQSERQSRRIGSRATARRPFLWIRL